MGERGGGGKALIFHPSATFCRYPTKRWWRMVRRYFFILMSITNVANIILNIYRHIHIYYKYKLTITEMIVTKYYLFIFIYSLFHQTMVVHKAV